MLCLEVHSTCTELRELLAKRPASIIVLLTSSLHASLRRADYIYLPLVLLKAVRESSCNISVLMLFGTMFDFLCKPQERHFCHLAAAQFLFCLPLSFPHSLEALSRGSQYKHWLTSVFCDVSTRSKLRSYKFPRDGAVWTVTSSTGDRPPSLHLISVDSCAATP